MGTQNGSAPPVPAIAFDTYHEAKLVGPDGKPLGGEIAMIRILKDGEPAGVIDVGGDPNWWIVTIYPQEKGHPAVCARVKGKAEAEDMVKTLLVAREKRKEPRPRVAAGP